MNKKILIVAGEASGDLHAASLVRQLKYVHPGIAFYGLGGKNMKTEGVDIAYDLTQIAVIGFFEILKNYSHFKKLFLDLLEKTKQEKPDAAILVDYPGFNLRLAQELKKMGIPVIYYISPQIWAWGRKRLATIKKCVSLMLVFFKFEEVLYRDGAFRVKFVGHPLLDMVKPSATREQLLNSIGFKKQATTLALLPGSREREITNLLPPMLAAALRIHAALPATQFLICRASTVPRELIKKILDQFKIDFPYKILDNQTHDGLAASDFAIVASGTATLETAILNKPMVIIYKVSFLTWLLAKLFIKIRYIGLVNVVAGKRLVPELVQFAATPANIARTTLKLLQDKNALEKIHTELYSLKNSLGIPGAAHRAAEEISAFLQTKA
ncbi:MAG: lipid-A-disaccharide synthase [Candidatus Omnitrophota bacterium]